jgi:hypothetical protein
MEDSEKGGILALIGGVLYGIIKLGDESIRVVDEIFLIIVDSFRSFNLGNTIATATEYSLEIAVVCAIGYFYLKRKSRE